MNTIPKKLTAEVVAVYPNKIKISVDNIQEFRLAEESLRVGSYLQIFDNENVILIAIIESFSIEAKENKAEEPEGSNEEREGNTRIYIIEAYPLGTLSDSKFKRGGDELAIPPKSVTPASKNVIRLIYSGSFETEKQFSFCCLSRERDVEVPVFGNKFFNKHVAIVGATGSGKSHSVAKIIQNALSSKNHGYDGLNNSHIVIFDIHSEYASAFPDANYLTVDDLILPYWLLDEDEMDELFLESGDNNNYNQASVLRTVITQNKIMENPSADKIYFDSPVNYDIEKVENCLVNLTQETRGTDDPMYIKTKDGEKNFLDENQKLCFFSSKKHSFAPLQRANQKDGKVGISRGSYAEGSIDKFVRRLQTKIHNPRLDFLFGKQTRTILFEDVLKNLTGYNKKSNVTIIDLSGIPFGVLSITVSVITRLLFDYSYYYKRKNTKCETPLLLVYEEAHKYAPKSHLARYKSSLAAIERVAKEGRKYGISLMIASQRPSEISETIFSQCSNFLAMRLTNPEDQSYVKRLLPDSIGTITSILPALESGEGLLIGDAVIMPSLVYMDRCDPQPSSNDIPYLDKWKEEWKDVDFGNITDEWKV